VPGGHHCALHLRDLRLAPKEARGRSPQVHRARVQRPQRRKVRAESAARTWNSPTATWTPVAEGNCGTASNSEAQATPERGVGDSRDEVLTDTLAEGGAERE
jgi:hypothetical protein